MGGTTLFGQTLCLELIFFLVILIYLLNCHLDKIFYRTKNVSHKILYKKDLIYYKANSHTILAIRVKS